MSILAARVILHPPRNKVVPLVNELGDTVWRPALASANVRQGSPMLLLQYRGDDEMFAARIAAHIDAHGEAVDGEDGAEDDDEDSDDEAEEEEEEEEEEEKEKPKPKPKRRCISR